MSTMHDETHLNQLYSQPFRLYPDQHADQLLDELINTVRWQHEYEAFGRRVTVPRLQAWYADEGVHYRYSDNLLGSHPWNQRLLEIKSDVERATGYGFNSVLLTYYRNGSDHVTWHADDEKELGEKPVIASLSLGETREFSYRHKKTLESFSLDLSSGELLIMLPDFQRDWEHCVPEQIEIEKPRVNLTFRNVIMTRKAAI